MSDDTQPAIHCGEFSSRIGGELHTATQCFDALGRLMLLHTDADDETLMKVIEIYEFTKGLLARISTDQPSTTAAQRHHQ